MVSSGCAAGLAHATAACIAGGNPDRHVRIPDLTGFPKDEVVIPRHSRNVYDQAIRSVGVRIVEVGTTEELEAALGPRVAMVYILASPRADAGPPSYADIVRLAKERNIPVLVDAAAEMLSIPNVHLQRGATMVGYSGGKCIRGPQCAGLLLGRKDLIQAAWVHSAPHHGYGRTMKVGKEEAMGMLMAVEMWVRRDHEAEDKLWTSWMEHIAKRVSAIDGVTATVREPTGLDNHSPVLSIRWDTDKIGISGEQVSHTLFTTEPRITLVGGGAYRSGNANASATETGVSITAYMMQPGEDKIVADRLHEVLSAAPKTKLVKETKPPAADLSGQWDVHIDFAAASSTHELFLRQDGGRIEGTHQGDYTPRDVAGAISGDAVEMTSRIGEQHGAALTLQVFRNRERRQYVGRPGYGRVPESQMDGHAAHVRTRPAGLRIHDESLAALVVLAWRGCLRPHWRRLRCCRSRATRCCGTRHRIRSNDFPTAGRKFPTPCWRR